MIMWCALDIRHWCCGVLLTSDTSVVVCSWHQTPVLWCALDIRHQWCGVPLTSDTSVVVCSWHQTHQCCGVPLTLDTSVVVCFWHQTLVLWCAPNIRHKCCGVPLTLDTSFVVCPWHQTIMFWCSPDSRHTSVVVCPWHQTLMLWCAPDGLIYQNIIQLYGVHLPLIFWYVLIPHREHIIDSTPIMDWFPWVLLSALPDTPLEYLPAYFTPSVAASVPPANTEAPLTKWMLADWFQGIITQVPGYGDNSVALLGPLVNTFPVLSFNLMCL